VYDFLFYNAILRTSETLHHLENLHMLITAGYVYRICEDILAHRASKIVNRNLLRCRRHFSWYNLNHGLWVGQHCSFQFSQCLT